MKPNVNNWPDPRRVESLSLLQSSLGAPRQPPQIFIRYSNVGGTVPNFQSDANISSVAAAYSLDAVDSAKRNFGVTLDGTDASIELVESMLKVMHEQMGGAKPDQKTIWTFAKMFGSYVGEVYRKHHGGEWGTIEMGNDRFPGIKATKGTEFWPWGRAYQRLTEGPSNNIWHYYQRLTASE